MGSPLPTSAASTADGPGTTVTVSPAAATARMTRDPRVGDSGHAGVTDQGHGPALSHRPDHLVHPVDLVVLVE